MGKLLSSLGGRYRMGQYIAIFIVSFVLAFGGGYFIIDAMQPDETAEKTEQTEQKEKSDQTAKEEVIDKQQGDSNDGEGRAIIQSGCISCHSVSALNIQGGATGPDLSQAYNNVEGKHGVPLDEFLKNPTSAVMSGVIGGDPLTDDERTAIIEALKAASEK